MELQLPDNPPSQCICAELGHIQESALPGLKTHTKIGVANMSLGAKVLNGFHVGSGIFTHHWYS